MKLLVAAIAFVGGTLLGPELSGGAPLVALFLFALAAVLGALLFASMRRSPWPALIALAFILGVLRVALIGDARMPMYGPMYASPRSQQVDGVVLSDVEALGDFARFRLGLERIRAGGGEWMPADGVLLVSARATSEIAQQRQAPYFRYGDKLRVEGRISEPPELDGFDYAAYLARQGIVEVLDARRVTLIREGEGSVFYRTLYGMRRKLADSIATVVPEPQAALGQATLLGLRRNIPQDLNEAFRRTGTAHLLAISGLHVGVLLGISLAGSAALLGRKHHLHLIAPLLVIWLVWLAVRDVSIGNAGLHHGQRLSCFAMAFGRQRGSLAPIGVAAALMVAVSPSILYSISFQLSFAAIAGIAAFSDTFGDGLRSPIERRSLLRAPLAGITDMLGLSLAATITTVPLIAFHFERVSTLGIPVSVLTLPVLPFLIVGNAGAALVGLASAAFAMPFGWVAWGAGAYLSGVVTLLAGLPGASVEIGVVGLPVVIAFYGVLILAYGAKVMFPGTVRGFLRRMAVRRSPTSSPRRVGSLQQAAKTSPFGRIAIWLLVPAAFVASLTWSQALTNDDRLHVMFFDVGQGDAIFIETPGGRQVVVDGGSDPLLMTRLLGERMRFNDRHIDIVAATHPNSDHIGGLAQVLERYDVGAVLERRIEYESGAYEAWERLVDAEEAKGARVIEASAGQVIALDAVVRIEVLGPPPILLGGTESDADNASLVLRLVYGEVSILLTGDIFSEAERALLASGAALDSDVLKVPHHGSDSSSTRDFLSAVSPAAAVISVGEGNLYGHPHANVVKRLREYVADGMLFQTAERGTVEFISDGETLWVRTER